MKFALSPCPDDFLETAPGRYELELHVAATPERAFAIISGEGEEEWFPGFRSLTWNDAPGVGASRVLRLSTLTLQERFLVWEPGRAMRFEVDWMSLPLCRRFLEDYTLEPEHRGTRILWRIAYEATPALTPLRALLHPILGRDFKRASAGIERYAAKALKVRPPPSEAPPVPLRLRKPAD